MNYTFAKSICLFQNKGFRILFAVLLISMHAYAQGGRTALEQWKAGTVVSLDTCRAFGIDRCFKVEEISDATFRRMEGRSFKQGAAVSRTMLRYVKVLHYDANGQVKLGEMVCSRLIANDLVDIFRRLFNARYPIERMVLIDDYDADDERSMSANNTSCFCYRAVAGSKRLSAHSRGMAVDINPRYNPCVRKTRNGKVKISPANGSGYANRDKMSAYSLRKDDLCYTLFVAHGFKWGGAWRSVKDYQHFEK